MISKRIFWSVIAAACGCFIAVGPATAENYPSHPITMVLPFSAGGPTDTLARIIGARMQVLLGQPVIIENVTARRHHRRRPASRARHPTDIRSASGR